MEIYEIGCVWIDWWRVYLSSINMIICEYLIKFIKIVYDWFMNYFRFIFIIKLSIIVYIKIVQSYFIFDK